MSDGMHQDADLAPTPPAPFVTYERTVRQTKEVAEVTPENIGQIAALIGGSVDYAGGEPVLVVPHVGGSAPWRVEVGCMVSLLGNRLLNENGFNRNGDWSRAQRYTPDQHQADR
ncbi:MAG TPA: hypothetical protein VFH80_23680 [Solirubrobacteraceae bacterium]|nr:hypothetical protein [Solirubrobacteraceae bacterium]